MKGMGPRELAVRAVELLIGLTIAHLGVTLFLLIRTAACTCWYRSLSCWCCSWQPRASSR